MENKMLFVKINKRAKPKVKKKKKNYQTCIYRIITIPKITGSY